MEEAECLWLRAQFVVTVLRRVSLCHDDANELHALLDGLQGEETDIFVVKIVDQAYALQDVK